MTTLSPPYTSPTRSAVLTTRGLVCSASPLAGAAGAQVLREGGNAFDAAVATAAVETVTLPPMCGVGGEVFALLYEASGGKVWDVTGSGRAPTGATREFFTGRGYAKMPSEGPLTPTIPGEVDAWQTILDRFGTRTLAETIAPAIELAERGFPLPGRIGAYFPAYLDKLNRYPSTSKTLTRNGASYRAGDLLVLPNLAATLRRIAEHGAREFYEGALAAEIAAAVQEAGGLFTREDLAAHRTEVSEAKARTTYRGYEVLATAPPSQGFLPLEILNILEGDDLAAMGHNSPDAIHLMAEAVKLAFADRLAYMGDPAVMDNPLDELLDKRFAAARRAAIDPRRASAAAQAGALEAVGAGISPSTSYFCAIDAEGNAVSFVHSLSQYFGSGFVAGDTGVTLNDRAGRGFYLDEDHPNVIAPGKRTMNTIQTYMALRDGKPALVGGTPGGDRQPSWNAQMLVNVLDYGLNVQAAADAPRWHHFPGSDPATADEPFALRVEEGFDEAALDDLRARGHNVEQMPAGVTAGAVQLIAIDQASGVRSGGTDRRSDGYPTPE